MNIPMTLNGERVIVQAPADAPLISVLRAQKCLSVKTGCEQGVCGSCTVLLNGKPVPACKIPAAFAAHQSIETLEHFLRADWYSDVLRGFSKAGIKLCGYCNAGKIFAARQIIQSRHKPSRKDVMEQVRGLSPCCTDLDSLIDGILFAVEIYNNRKKNDHAGTRT
ncbi:MAG: 2Fe-2S iron-sulfur cluster binding domain-containing protein [Treponemataceae bacterium]|nr:2Fe-2S iron-sulfur cluster binding domain-containing protein [Treponemataceae bacterium]